ncbi:nucleotide sugar dehydrogenase [Actinoplanes sp. LDG1-06]|uniref:Nucleotide sugar dehydrogenase n=1 Tax=Paractinoplanes ovalisporus TaxID=2810368 RepID=A0ABS2AJX5_9ACTN|nr:nucleotide sugar dehydrogenase [Actinoplanes ovalisporus]MBM2620122.1 nucleotide sugar dehydrogenase [Actinoplanes ovalisporus]
MTPVFPATSSAPPRGRAVAVLGLGHVGICVAATLAVRGLTVIGVDADPEVAAAAGRGHSRIHEPGLDVLLGRAVETRRLSGTTDYAAVAAADVVLIAVGTPVLEDGELDDRALRAACESLAAVLRPGQLVVLKSTVPPGTTRTLVKPLLESNGLRAGADFGLAFAPERLAEGTALAELRTLPIVVGGLTPQNRDVAAAFWRDALGLPVLPQDSLEAAEIVKLADNWWIDANIALANELAKFCALYGADVLDVIAAANSIPKGAGTVNILLPSAGVGGSCLTKDPHMITRAAQRRGLRIRTAPTAREVNDGMPDHTAQLIIDELEAAGHDLTDAPVAVLGAAFKNDTGDLRATPARGVITALVKAGVEVRVHDPLVDPDAAERDLGVRPLADLDDAVRGARCVAVLAAHRAFAGLDWAALPVSRPCLVLDGRAYYPKEKIAMLRRSGFTYRGIGR